MNNIQEAVRNAWMFMILIVVGVQPKEGMLSKSLLLYVQCRTLTKIVNIISFIIIYD